MGGPGLGLRPRYGHCTLLRLILILRLRRCVDIHTDTDTVMVYWYYDVSYWHCGMIGSAVWVVYCLT